MPVGFFFRIEAKRQPPILGKPDSYFKTHPCHGCCWEAFYILAYCGLVGHPTTQLLKFRFLLPFRRQPRYWLAFSAGGWPGTADRAPKENKNKNTKREVRREAAAAVAELAPGNQQQACETRRRLKNLLGVDSRESPVPFFFFFCAGTPFGVVQWFRESPGRNI